MRMKLDDVELTKKVDEDGVIKELRIIVNLSLSGRRQIVELRIPGSKSNVFQDLGRDPLQISFQGELVGPGTKETLNAIRSKFELGKPVPFSSDIDPLTDITEVVIESFSTSFDNRAPSGSRYSLTLREHKPAKGPGETEPPSQEEEAKEEVKRKVRRMYFDMGLTGR